MESGSLWKFHLPSIRMESEKHFDFVRRAHKAGMMESLQRQVLGNPKKELQEDGFVEGNSGRRMKLHQLQLIVSTKKTWFPSAYWPTRLGSGGKALLPGWSNRYSDHLTQNTGTPVNTQKTLKKTAVGCNQPQSSYPFGFDPKAPFLRWGHQSLSYGETKRSHFLGLRPSECEAAFTVATLWHNKHWNVGFTEIGQANICLFWASLGQQKCTYT